LNSARRQISFIANGSTNDEIVASITLTPEAGDLWDDLNDQALYIRRIAVKRSHSRQKLGQEMLLWAENEACMRGVSKLRLTCDAKNSFLYEYYKGAGYLSRGVKRHAEYQMDLFRFEKQIDCP
jgi:hypothetical protein